ncbi:MAG: hypothetical protein JST00_20595 [Deltaproteobacteria bacterium]|nr:hypothetical protein [Deltaproteobacteria bacterium]
MSAVNAMTSMRAPSAPSATLRLLTPEIGSAPSWSLHEGQAFTLGAQGDWSLGRGVLLPIHALAYFDGRSLLIAGAHEGCDVRVDGRPIGTSWTPIDRRCRITLGPIAIELAPRPRVTTTVKRARLPWHAGLLSEMRRRAPLVAGGAAIAFTITLAVLRSSSAHELRRAAAPTANPAATMAAPAAPPPKAAATGVVVHPVVHPPRRKLGKTEERLAADAFHAGDRKKAAALYAELAAESPENEAFAAIAALLGSGQRSKQ